MGPDDAQGGDLRGDARVPADHPRGTEDTQSRQIAVVVPTAIAGRLDLLTRVADVAGESTSRRELLAAIVHAAPTSPRRLRSAIRQLREAKVQAAFVAGQPREAVLSPLRAPGPRQRRLWVERPHLGDVDDPETPTVRSLDPDDLLISGSTRRIGVEIPLPVCVRLDHLVRQAQSAHQKASRQELIAALVLAAPSAPGTLGRLIRAYRNAKIADTAVDSDDLAAYLDTATPTRGRPTRASSRSRRLCGSGSQIAGTRSRHDSSASTRASILSVLHANGARPLTR
jgi:hypothetical protein